MNFSIILNGKIGLFYIIVFVVLTMTFLNSCSKSDLESVGKIEKERMMGTWYEIATLPSTPNKGCSCNKLDLELAEGEDYIRMIYSCIKKGKQGAVLAKVFTDDKSGNARWRVQFFWPFRNTRHILVLDSEYNFAMIGNPDRDELQILSRQPEMQKETVDSLLIKAMNLGFETSAMVFPEQKCK